jgi:DNA-binding GntR family transcriptional regulator
VTLRTSFPQLASNSVGVQRGAQVFATLLAEITGGRLEPGAKLLIEELAASHGVSIAPVRDALARLESHGVVMRIPYQGFFVRTFEDREIQDLYEVRVGLEVLAVTLACARIRPEHIERLRQWQERGERALADKTSSPIRPATMTSTPPSWRPAAITS